MSSLSARLVQCRRHVDLHAPQERLVAQVLRHLGAERGHQRPTGVDASGPVKAINGRCTHVIWGKVSGYCCTVADD